MTERYGQIKVTKIISRLNRLRLAIRSEGSPEIQDAWDAVEPVIDFILQRFPHADAGKAASASRRIT